MSLILVICILMTTGCVWLRLLTFKKQLAEFDKFVNVSTTNGLSLKFVKPALYEDDVLFICDMCVPTVEHVNGTNKSVIYTFRKINPTNAVNNLTNAPLPYVDIPIQLDYENKLFCRVTFPDSFVKCLPENFIVNLFRSLGHAKVDTTKRSAAADMIAPTNLPNYKQITGLLGAPTAINNNDGKEQLSYWFETLSPQSVTQQKKKYYYLFRYDFNDKKQMTGLSVSSALNSLKLNK